MFAYIVEQNHVLIRDYASKILEKMKYKVNCATCEKILNQNIHYKGHIIKSLDSKCNIDRLPMGKDYLVTWKGWLGCFEKLIYNNS